ncbi:helix-turn-helix domain-containing protein [Klebsiella oxytoca]|uniref:hypothetical protein n=1 Tax=Klebsiella oxytoca TaxID=571 RepID=UPI002247AD1E|nr:hypothetical protein [Klebsiella oxytoca]MCW9445968.1 hypothetical protein [Klebsiella oxytoca]
MAPTIYTSTDITYVAINSILNDISILPNSDSDSDSDSDKFIFVFENNWINIDEFTRLNSRSNKKTLVICDWKVMIFIKAWFSSESFIFLPLNSILKDIIKTITIYMKNDFVISSFRTKKVCSVLKMNKAELDVLKLSLNGESMDSISKIMKLSDKRTYGIRRQALKKIGVVNIPLMVKYKEIIAISNFLIDVKKQVET